MYRLLRQRKQWWHWKRNCQRNIGSKLIVCWCRLENIFARDFVRTAQRARCWRCASRLESRITDRSSLRVERSGNFIPFDDGQFLSKLVDKMLLKFNIFATISAVLFDLPPSGRMGPFDSRRCGNDFSFFLKMTIIEPQKAKG